jgi:5'-nucleotidase (lipoprotein e(P4) family)
MRDTKRLPILVACLTCFFLGALWRNHEAGAVLADPTPPTTVAPRLPMRERIGANIYLQTAAEYRACCLQIYKCAELRLETVLATRRPKPSKPAIVMDLDETVFDNSAFQTFLYKNKLEYTDALWAVYEEKYPQDVALIPGAKKLIDKAEALGVTVVYISNRVETYRKSTEAALRRLGIDVGNISDRLFLRARDGTTDKSARREVAAARYNVLLYFGDNLRDFSEWFAAKKLSKEAPPDEYVKAIKLRAAQVDEAAGHWGVDWFVLPNPVYGEWEKLIGPDPLAIMHPTSMVKPENTR